jgi:20S proteasome alpha/beta subunit
MNSVLMPVNRPSPHKKPYTPEKPKGAKGMTIAVGFLCQDENYLILAADRQITARGAYKVRREKYVKNSQGTIDMAFFYSGEPGTFSSFTQRVASSLNTKAITREIIQDTIEETLESMRLRDPSFDPRFWLLAGICEFCEKPQLIVFDGKEVFRAKNGVNIIGCGDTSLIQYLSDQLYRPSLTLKQGIALGAYLIKKATQYVDGCGEPIDVLCGSDFGIGIEQQESILDKIQAIEAQEDFLFTLLVQKPFQP